MLGSGAMRRLAIALALVALFSAPAAQAGAQDSADGDAYGATVSAIDDVFTPEIVRVEPGQTVEWTMDGRSPHTVQADDGSWDSGNLEPGAEFTLTTEPHPGWDGSVNCRFVEIEAQRKLSYTWIVGDMEIDTVVTFTLAPTESGTRLSLVQSGFRPDQKQNFGGARYGWKLMGGKLVDLLGRIS